ncbi:MULTISPECIES: GNAT family N-acetyltransferase [unclassified Virgibacillus]|uniref:GNAT family N-acetyltransferase n=1 Tax=unclassified Virgibacillus TaxID=2620237 RepID=UPI0024DE033D|nr:GNAT family N-acetyltransferase [Virgibacillus sp. LDC-1]
MQLHFYHARFNDAVEEYKLSEEQLYYTGSPKQNIALSKADQDRYSVLAMEQERLVTFFVLHKNEGVKPYVSNNDAILLRSFSTDYRHQGKGYAKKALMLLPSFVKENFDHINEIVLAVNRNNESAQYLYKKCGYVDEGKRKMGKKGELILMSYYL